MYSVLSRSMFSEAMYLAMWTRARHVEAQKIRAQVKKYSFDLFLSQPVRIDCVRWPIPLSSASGFLLSNVSRRRWLSVSALSLQIHGIKSKNRHQRRHKTLYYLLLLPTHLPFETRPSRLRSLSIPVTMVNIWELRIPLLHHSKRWTNRWMLTNFL